MTRWVKCSTRGHDRGGHHLPRRHVFPTDDSTRLAFDWLQRHQLGRKRILDTQLAATLWSAGIQRLVTSNPADFAPLGFETLVP